jgi:murein DD-endopeptidase MepM/ murein hydrolase activator NlpD
MHKEISFFILSDSGNPVKRISVSNLVLYLSFFVLISLIVFAGYGIYDYMKVKRSVPDVHALENLLSDKSDELAVQREQIKTFADGINELKSKLIALNNFENKIRIIANLKDTEDEKGLFGIGGLMPENLDTQISPNEKHNSLMRKMHEQMTQLNQAAEGQEVKFKSLLQSLNEQVSLLAATPAIKPTEGWLTCAFGPRQSPFTGIPEFHKGMDIANRKGTPIVATADGIVAFSGMKGLMGNMVLIDHGHNIVTRYGHANKLIAKQGAKVKRGEVIALIGNTGRTTGPHVHYEVRINGVAVDPAKYILN